MSLEKEKSLVRKTSKSRLSKQAEVTEAEEPPASKGVKIPETRIESFDQLEEGQEGG